MKFTVKIGDLQRKVPVKTFDHKAASVLAVEAGAEPAGQVRMHLGKFGEWPAAARSALFQLWSSLRASRKVAAIAGKTTYAEPLALVLAGLRAGEGPDGASDWLAEAVAVVAACYEQPQWAGCAGKLIKKLNKVGLGGFTDADVLARITKAAVGTSGAPAGHGPNPTLLAQDFLGRFRASRSLQPPGKSDRVLHYFNGSFYEWERAWTEVSGEEMRALVTGDLQEHGGVERVTTTLVANVVENLRGRCLVKAAGRPLPFFINDYGPPGRLSDRKLLVLRNGMIDLEALAGGQPPTLLPHDPRWFGSSALPYDFMPDAKCPAFKKFLKRVLERDPDTGKALNKGDRRLQVLQEWFGYTLLPDARFQKFLLTVGEGGNGKGVVLNVWQRMLGLENVAHVSLDQLNGRFSLQALLGKLANICGDLCEIDAVAEGVLKRLTGQDNITVDRKNRDHMTMAPTVKLVFATNTLPRFADRSRGLWRRLMAMPFRIVIPDDQQDKSLIEKITPELPGVLNWALAGLARLVDQNGFTSCKVCDATASQHQIDCDPVVRFLDEEGFYPLPADGKTRRMLKDELYAAYRQWCEKGGYKPLSENSFSRQISKRPDVSSYRSSTGGACGKRPYYWVGIGKPLPIPEADDEADAGVDVLNDSEGA